MMTQDSRLSSGREQIGIGLQLWSVRELTERDMASALADVAMLGYTAVEFAGFGNAQPAAIRDALVANRLEAISAHVYYDTLLNALDGVIRDLHVLRCHRAIVPAFDRRLYRTLADAQRLADSLNVIAARLRREGIAFAYHNELDDLAPLGETTLWHTLVAHTDPALVDVQLDVFTAVLMDYDPAALMRVCLARICSVHVIDMRDGEYVPIGQGTLDWLSLIVAAKHAACKWLIVENDVPPHPLEDAAMNLRVLTELLDMPNV